MELKERKITDEDISLAIVYRNPNERSLTTTFACHEITPVRDLKKKVRSAAKYFEDLWQGSLSDQIIAVKRIKKDIKLREVGSNLVATFNLSFNPVDSACFQEVPLKQIGSKKPSYFDVPVICIDTAHLSFYQPCFIRNEKEILDTVQTTARTMLSQVIKDINTLNEQHIASYGLYELADESDTCEDVMFLVTLTDSKVRASKKEEEFQEEPGERVFLWLTSESDMNKLASIGILNPVLIDPEDNRGVEVIAFVPRTLYADLRANKYSFIKKFEDPEDPANYSHNSFN